MKRVKAKIRANFRRRVKRTLKGNLKEKLAGTILLCAIVPLAICGYIFIVVVGIFFSTARARQGVRALDHFVNASLFNGYAWESVSSHAWRERHTKKWAKFVIKITDFFDKNHCQKANRREQPVVDFVLSRNLDKQTIGRK